MKIQSVSILLSSLPVEHKVNLFGSYREAFGQISDEEVEVLIQISEWRSYGENDIIFSEDNPANYFFYC